MITHLQLGTLIPILSHQQQLRNTQVFCSIYRAVNRPKEIAFPNHDQKVAYYDKGGFMHTFTNEHIESVKQRAVKMKTVTTIQDFYKRLDAFDWYFSMSDSREAYERGLKGIQKLELLASCNDRFAILFENFREHKFSGEAWHNQKNAKPLLPKFECCVEIMEPVCHAGAYLMCAGAVNVREVWDKTSTNEGNFVLREISGTDRLLGVFTSYEDVNSAAQFAVTTTQIAYDDVLIENIQIFQSRDKFIYG
jgi:hypothetical protein